MGTTLELGGGSLSWQVEGESATSVHETLRGISALAALIGWPLTTDSASGTRVRVLEPGRHGKYLLV